MKRKYQYRGRKNRYKRIVISRMKSINKCIRLSSVKQALRVLHEFDVAIQKARQAAMGLPEYAAGGLSMDSLASVGDSGSEIIANPVK